MGGSNAGQGSGKRDLQTAGGEGREGRRHEGVDGKQMCRHGRLFQVPMASDGCQHHRTKQHLGSSDADVMPCTSHLERSTNVE